MAKTVDVATLYLGVFIGIFPFTLAKAVSQTMRIVSRSKAAHNTYLYMIWAIVICSPIFAIIDFLYLIGVITPSIAFVVATLILWTIHVQLFPQIIINRIGLLMRNRRRVVILKIVTVIAVGLVNLGVWVVWLRAFLPNATKADTENNFIFEYVDKSFFLALDLVLNFFFLYTVRSRLIAPGLSKYKRLFNGNVFLSVISCVMDACLLGMLQLPDPYEFVQFVPVVYIVKLYIEMTNASLISAVVSISNNESNDLSRSIRMQKRDRSGNMSQARCDCGKGRTVLRGARDEEAGVLGTTAECTVEPRGSFEFDLCPDDSSHKAIMKTVTTKISEESYHVRHSG